MQKCPTAARHALDLVVLQAKNKRVFILQISQQVSFGFALGDRSFYLPVDSLPLPRHRDESEQCGDDDFLVHGCSLSILINFWISSSLKKPPRWMTAYLHPSNSMIVSL